MSAMVYFKTEAGREEIRQRALNLPQSLRSLLVMIDGQRSTTELDEVIASLRLPGDALEQLQGQGLVETRLDGVVAGSQPTATVPDADAERYKVAYALANEAIGKHLGLKGYFLQLKLERCATLADLEVLAPDIAEALAKAKSDALGRRFLDDIRGLATA